jgi:hypothetical protein
MLDGTIRIDEDGATNIDRTPDPGCLTPVCLGLG